VGAWESPHVKDVFLSTIRTTLTPAARNLLSGMTPEPSRRLESGLCTAVTPFAAMSAISESSSQTVCAHLQVDIGEACGIYIYAYICMYVCMHVYISISIYIYIHLHI